MGGFPGLGLGVIGNTVRCRAQHRNIVGAIAGSKARPAAQQSETELLRQREKITRSLDMLEGYLAEGTLKTDTVNLATIAIACAVGYLNFRRVAPGWCVDRPRLVKLVETLFQRESFARTEPPKA